MTRFFIIIHVNIHIQHGDEVICLNLAYPAVRNTLRYVCYFTQEIVKLKELKVEV